MSIKEKLESLGRNSIQLKIARKETYKLGATRFGGKPDVPPDFVWPTYEGESYDHVVKDSSMKRIPSAGAMTPRTGAALVYIGLRIFRRCPLQTFRRIWRKTSSFQWSKSRWNRNVPILPGRTSARCSRMRRMTMLSTMHGRN